jgi:hypothetical protein
MRVVSALSHAEAGTTINTTRWEGAKLTRGGVVGTQMRLMARAVLHLHTEASTHAATASHVMGVPRDDAPVRRALADMQTALPPPTP